MEPISEPALQRHLKVLTRDIGVRLAGTDGERRAAEYAAAEFRCAGADVRIEDFAANARVVDEERLDVRIGGAWHRFPCSLFSNTPGTGGREGEAPLVFFEAPAEYQRPDLSHLRGKAVVHLGCHIESRDHYRRLMGADPAFLLFVDTRYPGAVPLADGMFPAYTRALGARPTVNVAFLDAWRWKEEGATAARLSVSGGMRPSRSQNVVAELPGSEPESGALFLGGHHDTQAGSAGADDNAAGVAGLIELARVLRPLPRRRTIRLISFGAEEQLSLGSASYVRAHRTELTQSGRLMINFDAYGSWMGWTELVCNGPAELEAYLRPFFSRRGLYPRFLPQVFPYADHFPFVAAGVPGVYVGRPNCSAGRFFHHRPDDDMSRVSTSVVASLLTTAADIMADAAGRDALPFSAGIPEDQNQRVQAFWNDLFGGWEQP